MLLTTPQQVLMFVGLLLIAALVEPLARFIRLPANAVLVLIGWAGSNLLVMQGIDTGLRWDNFRDIIFFVFIPALVFESSFKIDLRRLWRDLGTILILAMPAMLLTAFIAAALIYRGIDEAGGYPWIAALITGALLASTDPGALVQALRQRHGAERLELIFDGESMLNDALAIVFFGLLIALATKQYDMVNTGLVLRQFGVIFFGGIGVGAVAGVVMSAMMRWLPNAIAHGLITVAAGYLCYVFTDGILGWSGVMAVLVCGGVLSEYHRRHFSAELRRFLHELWDFIGYIANSMIMLLAGVTVTGVMFQEQWQSMLIGIAAVITARVVSVQLNLRLFDLFRRGQRLDRSERRMIAWGGVRGPVTLALALSLPLELDYWFTIQCIAYGVVLFDLFVQMPVLLSALKQRSLR
ncbi:MAG TPA: cation:proton antiporter [Gammaproteobacteria bacterium]|nr:cation:proton antiporter [Gammaproteobacteria bacterium]